MNEKLDLLLKMQFGNWTSEKKKVSDTEIVETYTGDINGRLKTVLNADGKPVSVEGILNGVSVKKTYTYNADGSISVSQEAE